MVNFGLICQIGMYCIFLFFVGFMIKILLQVTDNFSRKLHSNNWNAKKQQPAPTAAEPMNLLVMIVLFILNIGLISVKIGFHFENRKGDWPGILMVFIPIAVGLLIVVEIAVRIHLKYIRNKPGRCKKLVNPEQQADLQKSHAINPLDAKNKKDIYANGQKIRHFEFDFGRKLWHFFVMLIFIVICILGILYAKNHVLSPESEWSSATEEFWGDTIGTEYLRIAFIRHSIPLGQVIQFFAMYIGFVVIMIVEIGRHTKYFSFFLQGEASKLLRDKEIDILAAYSHFAVSYLLISLIFPPLLFYAILCLVCLADPVASLIGIRFGKRKIRWNGKTMEGTIAGAIVCFISMTIFAGPYYAFAGVGIFILIDLFTPRPLEMSDNLLLPIGCAIIFIFMSLMNIPYTNLLGL